MMLQSKSIGNKIAIARKRNNLSQAELALRVSISAQAVGKWERGESMPDISTLNRLAEILHVDLNYFSDNFVSTNIEFQEMTVRYPENMDIEEPPRRKRGWDMSKGNWVDADFSGLKDLQEKFGSSNMKNCKFSGSVMSGLVLKSNHIEKCDFSASDLSRSRIQASHIVDSSFIESSLADAEITSSHISKCHFQCANFSGIAFKSTSFVSNNIEGAIWYGASFYYSDISDVIFEGIMNDCSFEHCSFSKVTFENATLNNTFFKCRSLKRIRFINCQADRMTFEFLKNGKANLEGITQLNA